MSENTSEQRRDDRPDDELELLDLDVPADRAGDVVGGVQPEPGEHGLVANHNEMTAVTS